MFHNKNNSTKALFLFVGTGRKQTIGAKDKSGFTLIELVVIVCVIAFLVGCLLPMVSRSKMAVVQASCNDNQRQLACAWQMYADQNGGKLVNLGTSPGSYPLSANTPWRTDVVGRQLVVTIPKGYSPKDAWIYKVEMGYKQPTPNVPGPLFAYAPNPHILHCPGDRRYLSPVGTGFGWDSYSGVSLLNGEQGGLMNKSELLHPDKRFLWAEGADRCGENVGSWTMENYGSISAAFTDARFGDAPGVFHDHSSTFSFADGHVENHKWLDPSTIVFANRSAVYDGDESGDTKTEAQLFSIHDQQWVGSHYPGPQNP